MSGRQFIGTLHPAFNPFADTYLSEILTAVISAWSRMKPPDRRETEDRITFRLCGRLLNDPEFADLPYDVSCQHWLVGLDGELLGRLDLRFKHRHSQRDYFALESKRLHVHYPGGRFSTEYVTYAGDQGMMAFVVGPYSEGLPVGGMLGYIMDGDSVKAWSGLANCIEGQRTSLKLSANSGLVKSPLTFTIPSSLPSIPSLGETEHILSSHRLRLLHLLLPVFSRAN